MLWHKTKPYWVSVLTALALTACANTHTASATPNRLPEAAPPRPTPPALLLVPPMRPAPPENGSKQALLRHAALFGGYVAELENHNRAWRDWAGGL